MSNGFPPPPPDSPAPPPFVPPPSPVRAVPAARKPSALLPLLVVAGLALFTVVVAVAAAGLIIYTDRGGWSRPAEEDPGPVGPGPSSDPPPASQEPAADAAPAAPASDPPEAQPPQAAVERPDEPASEVERAPRPAGDPEATTPRRARRGGTVGNTLGGLPEAPPPPPPPAPIRVGGQIRQPAKIHDVRPAYPDIAQRARVQGTVIIEATIGKDGTIEEARVLRSIPLLDDAALQAVRQWRYEPTYLNGQPVPVIVTVTVQFTLQ